MTISQKLSPWHSRNQLDATNPRAHVQSWIRLSALLEKHKPPCSGPERLSPAEVTFFNTNNHTALPELLKMPAEDVLSMKQAHEAFVSGVEAQPDPLFTYSPGSRGIVTTAGGRYLPVVIISIRMLRRSASKLPIEVFLLSNDEYESFACETILPSLGAKCIVLNDVLRSATLSSGMSRFALKSFALAFSSFEDNLFLDADCFPLRDPDILLTSEPFTSRGLVTWPDFWRSTVSPQFFDISSVAPTDPALRPSTEAGEIVISKRSHEKTLALALYYNIYGADYYYPLLSQGAMGEGDKETFLAAALALNKPFHAVTEPVRAIGHLNDDDYLAGSAMVQYDPNEDYALTRDGLPNGFDGDTKSRARVRPFFVHANLPKFDPATLFNDFFNPTKAPSGEFWPIWIDRTETVESLGSDLERHFWEEIKGVACTYETRFKSWEGIHGICANVTEYYSAVFGKG